MNILGFLANNPKTTLKGLNFARSSLSEHIMSKVEPPVKFETSNYQYIYPVLTITYVLRFLALVVTKLHINYQPKNNPLGVEFRKIPSLVSLTSKNESICKKLSLTTINPKNNPLGVEFHKMFTLLSIYVLKRTGMQDLRRLALEVTKFHTNYRPQ